MTQFGYTLSSEEHGPNALVDHARRAEEVGFDFLSISDHFHPWVRAQGESPFVWGTLGGVAEATDDIDVGVGVVCPTVRIHPAIVAQASATAATMFDGTFTLGVGTGELLNEHVLGDAWPEHAVRLEMLEEAVEVIRGLWEGEQFSHRGEHFTVQNARLFTLPEEPPPVVVSAFGEQTARRAAAFGDGLWSSGPRENILSTYRDAGGEGPAYTQLHTCYADSEEEAVDTAHEMWPNSALPGELSSALPTPVHFEAATGMVSKDDIREGSIVTDPDPEPHIESLQEAVDAGYDHVYVHQIGPNQEDFLEFYESEVLPEVRSG